MHDREAIQSNLSEEIASKSHGDYPRLLGLMLEVSIQLILGSETPSGEGQNYKRRNPCGSRLTIELSASQELKNARDLSKNTTQ